MMQKNEATQCTVPATSAALEGHLSAVGYIASAWRHELTDSLIESMLTAQCNKDLLIK